MDSDNSKLIEQKVEDGSYFKDARDWYAFRYVYPFTTRAAILLVTVLLVFGSYTMIQITAKDYQQKQYPFPIYAEDQVRYVSTIKPLSTKKEPIDVSVARYLTSKYVAFRESYNAMNFTDNFNKQDLFNKIQALSSKKIFRDYNDYIDPDINPDSPIILYKNHTQRIINIKSIELKGNPLKPDYALVTYDAIEKSKAGEKVSTWKSEVDFMISDISKVFKKTMPLQFVVTRYRTYKL